ncbi:GerAB/ArcD/ProY family transporter [Paenibacillus harenae]|uniref:GerAB/ArcD/ProY family transporter n=1 Tax=Paenibacillus harenae TaxID=306543 RepID=UPI00279171F2|nr:endospore germination permease [Paenibacillus harenae]MDQ0059597.1 spore germination protein KB [Paenibacillus harenae]
MQRIGKSQLSIMIIVFLIGSTPLFELGLKARQDAWIAMAMAAVVGLLLTVIYVKLQKRAPEAGLAELCRMHFGKWLGGTVALVYTVWFSYESMRNVRDVGELTRMALLTVTPKWIIMLLILFVAAYTVSKGLEVFARIVQLLFPIVLISYLFIILLLFIAKLPEIDRLLPIMENGMGPITKAAFPDLVSFPFGQTVVFLVYWKHLKEKRELGKTTFKSQAGVSAFLIFMNMLVMSVLGPALSEVTSLPLLQAVQLIRLANFLERLDVIVTLLLFIGLYVKMTALYLAAVLTLKEVTGAAYRHFVWPVGLVVYAASFLEPNNTYHLWLGLDVTLKIVPLFQIVFPLLMLVAGVRKRYKRAASP